MKKATLLLLPVLALLASAHAQTTNIISNAYGPATIGSGTTSLITNGASFTGDITDNGQLLFNRTSSAITNSYVISGSGSVTVASASAVTLTASNTFTGPLTANNINGNNYASTATLILSNSLGNAIQGNLVIGNNTYNNNSGAVTVRASAANQFGPNSVLVFNDNNGGAPYFVMNASQTVAGLSGDMGSKGGAIEVNQYGDSANYGSQTLTVNVAAGTNYTLTAASAGQGSIRNIDNSGSSVLTLVKTGAGTQTLTNIAIAQTGGTVVNAGTLVVQSGATDSANITVNGGTMKLSGAAAIAAYSGTNVSIASGATFQLDGPDADNGESGFTHQGNAEFGGNSSSGSPLLISGAGTWLITGTTTNNVIELGNNNGNSLKINMAQGGLINVASGTLRSGGYSSPDWTSNKASLNVASGAAFELWDGDRPVTVDALTGGGLIGNALGNNDVTLLVGVANGSGTFSGSIQNNIMGSSGNTSRLTKLGTGTQVLSGTNTYSGLTTVSAGVLEFANPYAYYSNNNGGSFWSANYVTVSNGASLAFGVGGANGFSTSNITTILSALTNTSAKGFLSNSSVGFDVTGGNFTLTNNLGNSTNGTLGLVAYGNSTLILTGSNSYTGTTRIDSGTLQVGSGGTTGTLGSGSVTDNGSLVFNRSDAVTVSNAISGTGALLQSGSGTAILTASNSYSGVTTISAGTLQVGSGGTTGTLGSGSVTDNATLAFNRSDAVTVSNAISGAGSLVQNGSGTVILAGTNSFTGGTFVNAGTLKLGNSGILADSGNVTVSGAILDLGGYSETVAAVVLGSGTIANGTLTGSSYTLSNGTVSAGLAGGGSLTMSGSGTAILSGNNTYSGPTTISAGTLQVGNGGTSGSLGSGSVTDNGTLAVNRTDSLTLSGSISGTGVLKQNGSGTVILAANNSYDTTTISAGTLQVGNGGTTGTLGSGGVTDNATLAFNRTDSVTVSNTISGTGALNQLGSGTVILTANNSYGGTTISSGTLQVGNGGATGSFGSGAVTDNGSLVFNRSNTVSAANNISGTGSLQQAGSGTTILTGTLSYTGGTTVSSGALSIGSLGAQTQFYVGNGNNGKGDLLVNGGKLLNGTGYIGYDSNSVGSASVTSGTWSNGVNLYVGNYGSGTLSISGGVVTAAGTATIANNSGSTGSVIVTGGTWSNSMGLSVGNLGNGSLIIGNGTVSSGGSVYIAANSNSIGSATVNTGGVWNNSSTLLVGNYGTGTLTINGGSVSNQGGFLGYYAGSSGSVSVNSGFWTNSSHLYVGESGNGSLTINGGTVYNDIGIIGDKSGSTGSVTVNSGSWINKRDLYVAELGSASLTINGGTVSNANAFIAGTGGYGSANSTAQVVVKTNGTWNNAGALYVGSDGNGTLTIDGGTVNVAGLGRVTIGTFSNSVGTLNIGAGGSAGTLNVAYIESGAGSATLNVNATNTTTLGARLTAGIALNQLGTGTTILTGYNSQSGITTISAGTLQIGNGDTNGTLGSGSVTNNATLALNRSDSLTVSNSISGTGALLQLGAGTAILTGNNTYAGTTTISAGTLQIGNGGTNGTLSSGAVADNAALAFKRTDTITVSNAISGTGSLKQLGTGTAILTGNNSYGTTTISAGTLQVGSGGASGTLGSGAVTDNAILAFNRSDSITVSNAISGTGSLKQLGTGTAILTGSNSYGTTTISAGTLQVGSGGTSGTLGSGAVTNNGALTFNRSDSLNVSGAISGTGSLLQAGTGTTVLTGSNSMTGITTISAGTLQIGNGGSSGTLGRGDVVDNAALAFNRTNGIIVTNQISGTGSLAQNGSGTLTLAGVKTYTGGTVVNAGTLVTTTNEALADSGSLMVNAGGTFKLGGNETIASLNGAGTVDLGAKNLTLSSGSFSGALAGSSGDIYKTGDGVFTLSGTSSAFYGNLWLQSGTVVADSTTAFWERNYIILSEGATFTANQNIVVAAIQQNGGTVNGSGTITAASIITSEGIIDSAIKDSYPYHTGLLKYGDGTTTMNGANSYSGQTKVSGGTLALGANGSFATNSSAQIIEGSTLDLGSHNQALSDVKVNGTVAGSGTFTVNGTLSGSGTVTADTVVTGIHSPGNSPGMQTFGGNLTYVTGAGILLQVADNTTNNSPVTYDQILVGNNLNFSGATTLGLSFGDAGSLVDWSNDFWLSNQSWTLYSVSGITTGFGNLSLTSSNWTDSTGALFSDVLGSGIFALALDGQNVVLNYTSAVPEPSTYALVGLGAVALLVAARRRRV